MSNEIKISLDTEEAEEKIAKLKREVQELVDLLDQAGVSADIKAACVDSEES